MQQLPPYDVRESARARHVRLTVSARDGLVVVVPRRFPRRRIPLIVAARLEWIGRALERVSEHREALIAGRTELPDTIDLPGIGRSWRVVYAPSPASGARAREVAGEIRVTGAVNDVAAVHAALRRFCRARAAEALSRELADLSAEQALPFAAAGVRSQRTRWGSCSARGRISLNWALAFLPPELVRYVMLHELVHTLQLDHSPRFHALLAEREPEARTLSAGLRGAWRHVPPWASEGR